MIDDENIYFNSLEIMSTNELFSLRKQILLNAATESAKDYRSPLELSNTKNRLNDLFGYQYAYERGMNISLLEEKFNYFKDQRTESTIFSSGMGAIVNSLDTFLESKQAHVPLKVVFWGGYFETVQKLKKNYFLFDLLILESVDELYRVVSKGDFDILMIEPVPFSFTKKTYIHFPTLLNALQNFKTSSKIRLLIFDTTLTTMNLLPIKEIFDLNLYSKGLIVDVIQSLQKLNQFGLELSGGGLAISSVNSEFERQFIKNKKINRNLSGQNITVEQFLVLSTPFISSETTVKKFVDIILDKNEYLFQRLNQCNSDNVSIVMPRLILKEKVINAPFVLITSSDKEEINKLLHIIGNASISISYGTSFGFLDSRYDYIIQDFVTGESFIRISMGFFTSKTEINQIANLINVWGSNVR